MGVDAKQGELRRGFQPHTHTHISLSFQFFLEGIYILLYLPMMYFSLMSRENTSEELEFLK